MYIYIYVYTSNKLPELGLYRIIIKFIIYNRDLSFDMPSFEIYISANPNNVIGGYMKNGFMK